MNPPAGWDEILWAWRDYLSAFVYPIITLFAIMSTFLNCMQVELAEQMHDGE
jgi:hypothetical protein